MIIPAHATGATVVFASGSSFRAGGTVTVDDMATIISIMSDPNVTSDMYNAAQENT